MKVQVLAVNVPAYSTIGYAIGMKVEDGADVRFAGDHRPMRDIGEALDAGEYVEVDIDDWQVI